MKQQIFDVLQHLAPLKQSLEQGESLWAIIALLLFSLLLALRLIRQQKDQALKLKSELAKYKNKNLASSDIDQEEADLSHDTQSREAKLSADKELEHSLSGGLAKTRSRFFSGLKALFDSKGGAEDEFLSGLEELLITSDLGVKTTQQLLQRFRENFDPKNIDINAVRAELKSEITKILDDDQDPLIEPRKVAGMPKVIIVVGVNGVGKTTTIGKLAAQFRVQGANVLIGAGDTFRAAAGAQLEEWARRADAELVQGAENAKPTTVAYETISRGVREGFDVIILDTAGRLHTKVNLMNELAAVVKIVKRELPGAPHETLLVLDASTGQNAIQQAREFHSCVDLTGIIVTKLDGTPKGGVVVAIKDELKTPIRYIGIGEGLGDLRPFAADEFVAALFDEGSLVEEQGDGSAHGDLRRGRRRTA